jgi:clan AA aspartic protease
MMRPMVDVEVIGSKGRATVRALIDTAFTGYVCIPSKLGQELGLVLVGEEEYELANGQFAVQFYFEGKVNFMGRTQEAQILVSTSPTPLIGTLLLADFRLMIDFPNEKVSVTRRKRQD